MPKKLFYLLFVICLPAVLVGYLFSVFVSPSLAQVPTISPSPTGQPTCDLCGWCNQTVNPTPPPNWQQCQTCLYDAAGAEIPKHYYTVLGCLSTEPQEFVKSLLGVVFSISGGIAFLAVLGGSAIVLTSTGDPERLQFGKDMVTSSIFGLLLIIFSIFLLRFVGYDVLRIPGFG